MATAENPDGNLSDEIYDYVCTPCKWKSKVRKSEQYCSECTSQFCEVCLSLRNCIHDGHVLLAPSDVSNFQLKTDAFERCGKHPRFGIEFFCGNCIELLCHTCALRHRGCGSAVVSIPQKIKDLYKDSGVKKIITKLQETVTKLRSGAADIKRRRDSIRKCKIDAVGKVREHFEKVATILKAIETKTIGEIETTCAGIEDEMQVNTGEVDNIEAGVKECLGKMSVESSPTAAQLVINIKKGETLVSSADQVLQKTDKLSRRRLGTYHLNRGIERYLGRINMVGCFNPTYSVENKAMYKVKMSGEVECNIQHSCLLPDGRVLLSDSNNKKLKYFSPCSNAVTETCSMPSNPRGVCCIGPQEVAVALDKKTVKIVTFISSPKVSRSFKVDHDCWGIAYKDDCLFITDYDTKVYIHSMDGSLVQVITVPGVSATYDVALSPGGELLYVTSNSGLTCLERCGRPVYTRGAGKFVCTGVCVDENGCVLVCDFSSKSVVQVGEDGCVLAEVLGRSDAVMYPWPVCVDSDNMKLYVTSCDSNELLLADIVAK